MTTAELMAFIIAAVMASGTFLTARSTVRKNDFDALCATVKTLQEENGRLSKHVAEMETERKSNRGRIEQLEAQVSDLEEQVRKLGGIPVTETKSA